jgi:hypothetical protein
MPVLPGYMGTHTAFEFFNGQIHSLTQFFIVSGKVFPTRLQVPDRHGCFSSADHSVPWAGPVADVVNYF